MLINIHHIETCHVKFLRCLQVIIVIITPLGLKKNAAISIPFDRPVAKTLAASFFRFWFLHRKKRI